MDLTVDDGRKAARLCALNMLPHLRQACQGDLDRVVRCLEIGGFVNSTPEFTEHGLPDECVLHGLRKTAARKLAEAGATEEQIRAVTGHSTSRMVAHYTRGANQRRLATRRDP